jgi:hypothetical protein
VKKLAKNGNISELFRTLERISKLNGTNLTVEALQKSAGIPHIDLRAEKYELRTKTTCLQKMQLSIRNYGRLFCTSYIVRLTGYFIINLTGYIQFSGVTYNSANIGLPSIQTNVMFLCGVQGLSYLFTMFFISKTKRKTGLLITNLIFLCCAVLLLVLHNFVPDFKGEKWIETLTVCILIRGGLSFQFSIVYNYGAELFDAEVRGSAIAIGLTLAKMASFVSTYVVEFTEQNLHTNPMVGCAALCVFALPALLMVPETFGKRVQ